MPRNGMRRNWTRLGLMLAAGLLIGSAAPAGAADKTVPPSQEAVRYSFAPIVKRVAPGVVNVYASRTVRQQASPMFSDPFFRQFFGNDGPFGGGAPRTRVQQSLGSGVVVDASGVVVTNYHVIANADEVKVALSDKRELPADIIFKDQRLDLAVLRVKGGNGNFPVVQFADSDALEVGDLVLAIGDPFGVGQTVTSGIVSALARSQIGSSDYQFYIQTDAAINPGNSGGALVDMDGRLVGINTMIFSQTGGSVGIGFAIPSNLVRTVAKAALGNGKVQLPWIGADFQTLTPDIAAGLKTSQLSGALVNDVMKGSPAERAGLRSGDVVTSVDGIEVDDPNALNYRLVTKGVGSDVKLAIVRDGSASTVSVALEAAPETPPRDERSIDGGNSPFAGATIVNLSPAVIEETGYKGKRQSGVLVEKIADGSVAEQVGFQAGDLIVDVNGTKIDNTSRLAAVAGRDASSWTMTIERNGRLIRTQLGG